jgi:hypothetical protein
LGLAIEAEPVEPADHWVYGVAVLVENTPLVEMVAAGRSPERIAGEEPLAGSAGQCKADAAAAGAADCRPLHPSRLSAVEIHPDSGQVLHTSCSIEAWWKWSWESRPH